MIGFEDLTHVVPGAAVYFPLSRPLEKGELSSAHEAIVRSSGSEPNGFALEAHWGALERRLTGQHRWDTIVPRRAMPPLDAALEAHREWNSTHLTPESLARRSGHFSPVVDGVRYTLDYFNPGNELGLSYREAGEVVLVLIMQNAEQPPFGRPRLVGNYMPDSFAAIIRDLFALLGPKGVFGCYSIMSTLAAFLEGRVPPRFSPWDFLHQLHLLKNPPIAITAETRIPGTLVGLLPGKEARFHRVESYGDHAVLVQINAGFDRALSWEYFAIAKALKMHCIQELCEGTII